MYTHLKTITIETILLAALVFGVEALKSPLLMLASAERRLEPKEAVLLSRLEEEYQVSSALVYYALGMVRMRMARDREKWCERE